MADFSYTDPSDSDKDHVRLLIGDTDEKDYLLMDVEVEFFLSIENNQIYMAASSCAEAMAAKVAREVTNSLEQASEQLSDQYRHFKELARTLKVDAQKNGEKAVVSTGGVTSTGATRDPIFTIGMDDNPGTRTSEELRWL